MESFKPYIAGIEDVKLISGDTNGVMALMDCAVVASGTATLQVGLHNKPMVIMYRLSPLTYRIGRLLIKVKYIGLVNLVLGGLVVPELIQDEATPENISSLVSRTFTDGKYRLEMIEKLKENQESLADYLESLESTNKQLKQTQEELIRSEKLASVGRFAAGVAHEVGNPLAGILGYLSLASARTKEPELQEYLAQHAQREVEDERLRGQRQAPAQVHATHGILTGTHPGAQVQRAIWRPSPSPGCP